MYSANVIYSLRYPAWNAHAPYCHLWPAWIHTIFTHYLINGRILEKKIEYLMCVSIFSIILSETFLIPIRIDQDLITHVYSPSRQSACYSCPIWMKLKFPVHILEKYSKTKFHENPFSKSRVLFFHADGQTNGRTPFASVQTRIKRNWTYQACLTQYTIEYPSIY